jgi:hypothetical protein
MVEKELRKFSQWFCKGFLKWYDGGGENGITSKMILKLKCISPLKMLTSPLFEETLGAFLSLPLFSLFFCSVSWGLRGLDDVWGENYFFKNFFSNGFNILAVDAYSRVELYMPTWLNHDYGDGGVVDILAVDAYSGVELCTLIFLGEASKLFLNFFFETQMNTSLNKAHHKQELLYGKYLALVGICMSLRKLPKFIQLWKISKSRFSKINTNSDITPPNNIDMVTFEFFAHMKFCVYQGITTLISPVYQNRAHPQMVATNLKQRRMYNLIMSCGSSFYWLDKHLTKGSITY